MLVSSAATIAQTSGDEKRGYELEARPRTKGENSRMESGTSQTKERFKRHMSRPERNHILLQAKPVPSHTQANMRTSPAVPALKPSYSQVTRLGIRAHDPGKQHVTGACDRPYDLQVLWGSHDPRACDPVKKTGDLPRDWSATRSGNYRYVTRPLNHPMGTTNRGVRINKVVQLRIIGAQPQQPQQMGHPQLMAPQRGKGPTCVPYVNLP